MKHSSRYIVIAVATIFCAQPLQAKIEYLLGGCGAAAVSAGFATLLYQDLQTICKDENTLADEARNDLLEKMNDLITQSDSPEELESIKQEYSGAFNQLHSKIQVKKIAALMRGYFAGTGLATAIGFLTVCYLQVK